MSVAGDTSHRLARSGKETFGGLGSGKSHTANTTARISITSTTCGKPCAQNLCASLCVWILLELEVTGLKEF